MNSRVLFVDDEPNILQGYRRALWEKYEVTTAEGGDEGLKVVEQSGPFAVVVADMRMPKMTGLEVLRRLRERAPNTVRIMLTGNVDQKTAADAVNEGHVFRFLTKPCSPEDLIDAISTGLEQYRVACAEAELLSKTLIGSINVLTEIFALADPTSFRQARTVSELVRKVAPAIGMTNTWELELGATLARIGQLTVPPEVVARYGKGQTLSPEEARVLGRVPDIGHDLLRKIPRLEGVSAIVQYQSVRYDGTGGPADGLTDEFIPLGARVLKILADLVEMESTGTPRSVAARVLRNRPGWYDPKLLDGILEALHPTNTKLEIAPDLTGPENAPRINEAEEEPESEAEPDVAEIGFADLGIGDVVAEDIRASDKSLLIPARTVITAANLHRLKNYVNLKGVSEPIFILTMEEAPTAKPAKKAA